MLPQDSSIISRIWTIITVFQTAVAQGRHTLGGKLVSKVARAVRHRSKARLYIYNAVLMSQLVLNLVTTRKYSQASGQKQARIKIVNTINELKKQWKFSSLSLEFHLIARSLICSLDLFHITNQPNTPDKDNKHSRASGWKHPKGNKSARHK